MRLLTRVYGITSSQVKVSLNVRNVFLDQSTPEIMTKVHVLSGLSVKAVLKS